MTTYSVFFFNDTATTEIYTLSLHDALPIYDSSISTACAPSAQDRFAQQPKLGRLCDRCGSIPRSDRAVLDRKSTRLNSSHANISYAVFCLKKKITPKRITVILHFTTLAPLL